MVLTEPVTLEAPESPLDSSGTVTMSGTSLVRSQRGSLAFTMKLLYFEFGLVLLLCLRNGLVLGVGGSFVTLWSELPAPPPVAPGPPSASPDASKSTDGAGPPVVGNACPGRSVVWG